MAVPSTLDEFLDLVRKSGVVEEKRLDAFLQKLRAQPGALSEDPIKLAQSFVREGVLTHFQAEQILQGKWRRFTIGKYKVLERLGSGGMGSVYLCEHKFMRRRAAVKVLPAAKAEDPASLERFYREARAVAALDHPNIVRAYDIDQDEKLHFLVMEYVDGASFQELIKKFGPLEIKRAAHYIRQAAVGLEHAHQAAGLVHRDIKPGNILVDRTGMVKVLDMGLARFFHDEDDILTKKYDENVLGTADYLAPEQALDSHSVDIRADIYSLGATFYFMLTGSTPFSEGTVAQKLIWHQTRQPKPVRNLRPEVPAELVMVLEKMMAKSPAQRYQTPAEVVQALEPFTREAVPPPPEREMPLLSPAATGTSPGEFSMTSVVKPPAPMQQRPPAPPVTPLPPNRGPVSPAPTTKPSPQASGKSPPPQPAGTRRTIAAPPNRSTQLTSGLNAASSPTVEATPRESLAPETEDLTASLDTAPVRPPSARPSPAVMKKRRLWKMAAIAGILIALLGASIAWWKFTKEKGDPKDPAAQPSGTVLHVTQADHPKGFKTIREALQHAHDGDRIVVLDEKIEEDLTLDESRKRPKDLTIEGGWADKQVLWTCPPNPKEGKFIKLGNVAGLKLRGFTLDGMGRVNDLVWINGKCPGLHLDSLQLQGFLKNAVTVFNATGEADATPITFTRLRMITAKDSAAALIFNVNSKVIPPHNQHLVVSDCRFEGPFKDAVDILGPLLDAKFIRNRFYGAVNGIAYRKVTPRFPIRLTLESNTFSNISQRAISLEGLPMPGSSQVRVKNNLFANTPALAQLDESSTDAIAKKVFPQLEGNARDQVSKEGTLDLKAVPHSFLLPTNPDDDSQFLRYPKSSPLFQAGADQKPVGVGPD